MSGQPIYLGSMNYDTLDEIVEERRKGIYNPDSLLGKGIEKLREISLLKYVPILNHFSTKRAEKYLKKDLGKIVSDQKTLRNSTSDNQELQARYDYQHGGTFDSLLNDIAKKTGVQKGGDSHYTYQSNVVRRANEIIQEYNKIERKSGLNESKSNENEQEVKEIYSGIQKKITSCLSSELPSMRLAGANLAITLGHNLKGDKDTKPGLADTQLKGALLGNYGFGADIETGNGKTYTIIASALMDRGEIKKDNEGKKRIYPKNIDIFCPTRELAIRDKKENEDIYKLAGTNVGLIVEDSLVNDRVAALSDEFYEKYSKPFQSILESVPLRNASKDELQIRTDQRNAQIEQFNQDVSAELMSGTKDLVDAINKEVLTFGENCNYVNEFNLKDKIRNIAEYAYNNIVADGDTKTDDTKSQKTLKGIVEGIIAEGIRQAKKTEYQKQVIYTTIDERAFDMLKDASNTLPGERIQEEREKLMSNSMAIVDEADQSMVTKATNPKVISGEPVPDNTYRKSMIAVFAEYVHNEDFMSQKKKSVFDTGNIKEIWQKHSKWNSLASTIQKTWSDYVDSVTGSYGGWWLEEFIQRFDNSKSRPITKAGARKLTKSLTTKRTYEGSLQETIELFKMTPEQQGNTRNQSDINSPLDWICSQYNIRLMDEDRLVDVLYKVIKHKAHDHRKGISRMDHDNKIKLYAELTKDDLDTFKDLEKDNWDRSIPTEENTASDYKRITCALDDISLFITQLHKARTQMTAHGSTVSASADYIFDKETKVYDKTTGGEAIGSEFSGGLSVALDIINRKRETERLTEILEPLKELESMLTEDWSLSYVQKIKTGIEQVEENAKKQIGEQDYTSIINELSTKNNYFKGIAKRLKDFEGDSEIISDIIKELGSITVENVNVKIEGLEQTIENLDYINIKKNFTLTSCSIDNVTLFNKYKNLFFTSGTLLPVRSPLQEHYNVRVVDLESRFEKDKKLAWDYLLKKMKRFDTADEKYESIAATAAQSFVNGRPVQVHVMSEDEAKIIHKKVIKQIDRIEADKSQYGEGLIIPSLSWTEKNRPKFQHLDYRTQTKTGEVVSTIGKGYKLTFISNLAARGQNPRLGGTGEDYNEDDRKKVASLGGLLTISGNVEPDMTYLEYIQLCGRSGRAGEPGEVQLNISRDDPKFPLINGMSFAHPFYIKNKFNETVSQISGSIKRNAAYCIDDMLSRAYKEKDRQLLSLVEAYKKREVEFEDEKLNETQFNNISGKYRKDLTSILNQFTHGLEKFSETKENLQANVTEIYEVNKSLGRKVMDLYAKKSWLAFPLVGLAKAMFPLTTIAGGLAAATAMYGVGRLSKNKVIRNSWMAVPAYTALCATSLATSSILAAGVSMGIMGIPRLWNYFKTRYGPKQYQTGQPKHKIEPTPVRQALRLVGDNYMLVATALSAGAAFLAGGVGVAGTVLFGAGPFFLLHRQLMKRDEKRTVERLRTTASYDIARLEEMVKNIKPEVDGII